MYSRVIKAFPAERHMPVLVYPPGLTGGVAAILSRFSAFVCVFFMSVFLAPFVCEATEQRSSFRRQQNPPNLRWFRCPNLGRQQLSGG